MRLSRSSFVLALVSLVSLVSLAAPSTAHASDTVTTTVYDGGYGYKFDDDLSGGEGLRATAPQIRVVGHAVRTVLIRPRTNFVAEMLKSVEAL